MYCEAQAAVGIYVQKGAFTRYPVVLFGRDSSELPVDIRTKRSTLNHKALTFLAC
jgi:hypothetical protein